MTALLKIVLASFVAVFLHDTSYCTVFVYEVTLGDGVFVTASKKEPATYVYSNGGQDVIKSLKILKTFDDRGIKDAIEEFGLGAKNEKRFNKNYVGDGGVSITPYIWWR